jgi:hypothetical protein
MKRLTSRFVFVFLFLTSHIVAQQVSGRELASRWVLVPPARLPEQGRVQFEQITNDIGRLQPNEFVIFIRELDRLVGPRDEGTLAIAVSTFVRRNDRILASDLILKLLDGRDVSKRLRLTLVNTAEIWTDPNDVHFVEETLERLSRIAHPNDEIPVDYGICKLLQTAFFNARREARQADADTILKLAIARTTHSLPELVNRALDDDILPEKGQGTMKMFAIYRRVMGEVFDQNLIGAFGKSHVGVPTQVAIIDRMSPWVERSAPFGDYLARLRAESAQGTIVLSPGELAIVDKLLIRYHSMAGQSTASTARAQPLTPNASPAQSQTKLAPTATAQQVQRERGVINWWLPAAGLALVVVAATFLLWRLQRK